ncbi:hypothetical protein Esi_0292_0007 [Ectocarpus siliculosus]|uniref:Uncharacterized protein n=1 Tax=Ectocarpus siliculosus TaxID=2880 RepID=D8LKA4_ECTSI|nr:hypothetical protein Esi_0292_0007 [Ectocarpus siliculosus]|eukprot:CBN76049.1 hypothetical protein Esi_0292_0007 [Ectocarpus siliculosus]
MYQVLSRVPLMRGRLVTMPGSGGDSLVIPDEAPYLPCKTKVRVRALGAG